MTQKNNFPVITLALLRHFNSTMEAYGHDADDGMLAILAVISAIE